jgi:hypothetical protein
LIFKLENSAASLFKPARAARWGLQRMHMALLLLLLAVFVTVFVNSVGRFPVFCTAWPCCYFCWPIFPISGETCHTKIAHRYGIPVASIRDALYDVMYDDQVLLATTGMTQKQLLSPIVVHPSTAGHVLYSKVIA